MNSEEYKHPVMRNIPQGAPPAYYWMIEDAFKDGFKEGFRQNLQERLELERQKLRTEATEQLREKILVAVAEKFPESICSVTKQVYAAKDLERLLKLLTNIAYTTKISEAKEYLLDFNGEDEDKK